ncbi:MAG: hypothetical protein ACKOWF_11470, partial [Chloroflexota bacterium]
MEHWLVRRRGDLIASLLLLGLSLAFLLDDLLLPEEYAFSDMVAFFSPMYAFLGHGLRHLDIFGWNPHQFSGAPFAADPESGWMYFPVMLIFTIFPPGATTYLLHAFVHLALALIGCYVFARLIGLDLTGSFAAAVAAVFPQLLRHAPCCPPLAQVHAWLPLLLVGAELSLRASSRASRFAGWSIAAIATSQVLAAWVGQGAYNAVLLLAAWFAWRVVFVPSRPGLSLVPRFAAAAVDGAAILLLGAGIAAAGLLPRIAFNAVSTVPGGVYLHEQGHFSQGWSLAKAVTAYLSGYSGGLRWYLGAAVIALVLAAPVIARLWAHMPFFLAVSALIVVLTLAAETPVHRILYAILPRFEMMHVHAPERILVVIGLPIGLLAGSAVSWLPRWTGRRALLLAAAILPLAIVGLILAASGGPDPAITRNTMLIIAAVSTLLALAALVLPVPTAPPSLALRVIPLSLIALIIWDPAGIAFANHLARNHLRWEALVDLDEYVRRTPAADFLAAQATEDPSRYFCFDLRRLPPPGEQTWGYLRQEADPDDILVNNRATALRIDDVQGYNPVHLLRYREYIDALNNAPQDYHETSVLLSGLQSPLLDMLAARFILLRNEAGGRFSAAIRDANPLVFQDRAIGVFERASALPRAWLVHEAR